MISKYFYDTEEVMLDKNIFICHHSYPLTASHSVTVGIEKITLLFVNRLDFDIFTLANPSTEGLCSGTDYIQVLVFVISIY